MSKVYVLLIQNYDALDGYMTSNDVEVFIGSNVRTVIGGLNDEINRKAKEL